MKLGDSVVVEVEKDYWVPAVYGYYNPDNPHPGEEPCFWYVGGGPVTLGYGVGEHPVKPHTEDMEFHREPFGLTRLKEES